MYNNSINGNASQNIGTKWPYSTNLLSINILNGRNDLVTPEVRTAMVSMLDDKQDDGIVILECNNEELAGLPDCCGI